MTLAEDDLALLIDRLDNIAHMAKNKALPDSIHMQFFRESLPTLVEEFKSTYAAVTGGNPWEK